MTKKINLIQYPVKIHLAGCECPYYKKKSTNNNEIIVAPYKIEEYKKRYYIYENEIFLKKDIELFEDQCLCTYNKCLCLNGGVVLLSKFGISDMKFKDTDEMINFKFHKISSINGFTDNSKLIDCFYNWINETVPELLDFMVLIGKTFGTTNFSFPKGKIKYGETSEECAYREFEEETGVELKPILTQGKFQIAQREKININLPLEIKFNNFLLKIIII
jgi:hypothetical protein